MRHLNLILWALSLCIGSLPALTPPLTYGQSATPLLHSTARNVILDIVVTDQQGRPIRNLKPADFTVEEDNQPQKFKMIASPAANPAELSPLSVSRASVVDSSSEDALALPHTRNIILFDEMNVRFFDLAFGRQRLAVFLRSKAAQGQEFALLAMTSTGTILVHDFTRDTGSIADALKKLPAAMPSTGANDYVDDVREMEDLRRSVGVLETIGHAMSGSADHVNLFWITSGFPQLAYMTSSPEMQFSFDEMMRHISNLYLDARLTLYTIDPHGVQYDSSLPSHNGSLDQGAVSAQQLFNMNTAGQFAAQTDQMTDNQAVANSVLGQMDALTGGRGYGNQNDIEVPLAQAVDDGSSIYTVAYSPSNKEFNGEYRHISVKVNRPGLEARTRDGYYAFPQGVQSTPEEHKRQLEIALDSPLSYLGLNVAGELHNLDGRPILRVRIEPPQVEWKYDEGGAHVAQTIAVAAYSSRNLPILSRQWQVTLDRPDLAVNGELVYAFPFQIPADTARLRLVVSDRNGHRIGTSDIPFTAADLHQTNGPKFGPLQRRTPADDSPH